jgi:hypothetical protein
MHLNFPLYSLQLLVIGIFTKNIVPEHLLIPFSAAVSNTQFKGSFPVSHLPF